MKTFQYLGLGLLLGFFIPSAQHASADGEPPMLSSSDNIWQTVNENEIPAANKRTNITGTYAVIRINKPMFDQYRGPAPLENTPAAANNNTVITLPMPDGTFSRFRIVESPIMAPSLAAAFPETKTYSGQGLDDPTASARIDWTAEGGFHAMILKSGESVYVDPYSKDDLTTYVSYRESDLVRPPGDNQPR